MFLNEIIKDLNNGHWAFRASDPSWDDDTFLKIEDDVFLYHCGTPGEVSVVTGYTITTEDLTDDSWEAINPVVFINNRATELESKILPWLKGKGEFIVTYKDYYYFDMIRTSHNPEMIKFRLDGSNSELIIEEYCYEKWIPIGRPSNDWMHLAGKLADYTDKGIA